MEDDLVRVFGALLMRLERREQPVDTAKEALIDDALVFQCIDLLFPVEALLVDLVLFCPDKRTLVDVGMDFNVRVIAELKIVLR